MDEELLRIKTLLKKHGYEAIVNIHLEDDRVNAIFPENILKYPTKGKLEIEYQLKRGKEKSTLSINRSSDKESTDFLVPSYSPSVLAFLDIIGVCRAIDYNQMFLVIKDHQGNEIPIVGDLFNIEEKDKVRAGMLTELTAIAFSNGFPDDYNMLAQEKDILEGYSLVQKFGRFKQ